MRKWGVAAIAFLLVAFVAALIHAIFAPLAESRSALAGVVVSLFVYLPFSTGFTLLFGVPLFLAFDRLGKLSLVNSAIAGLIGGAAVSFVIRLPNYPPVKELLGDAIAGAASGLVFWIVWTRLQGKPLRSE
jgi:hypothetical protein